MKIKTNELNIYFEHRNFQHSYARIYTLENYKLVNIIYLTSLISELQKFSISWQKKANSQGGIFSPIFFNIYTSDISTFPKHKQLTITPIWTPLYLREEGYNTHY